MNQLEKNIVVFYSLFALVGFLYSLYKCVKKNDNLGSAHIFNLIGAFVWADAVVFGIFWFVSGLVTIYLKDWILFLLLQSTFWSIRFLGETFYWFNQQFSKAVAEQNERLWVHKIFKDNYTSWFVMQIISQCETVIAIILTIYFGHLWISNF